MKKLRALFLSGLAFIVPSFISIYIIVILFVKVNNILRLIKFPFIQNVYITKILGVLIILGLILFFGILTRLYIGRKLIHIYNKLMSRVPVVNKIYELLLNIIDLIHASKDRLYKNVVLVEYPKEDSFVLGFLMNSEVRGLREEKLCAVFVPTTPNPTSGFLLLLPPDKVQPVDLTIEQAFKLIISGGLIQKNDQ